MKNIIIHIFAALVVIFFFTYQIYSSVERFFIPIFIIQFLFFSGGVFLILDIGYKLNSKYMNCANFYCWTSNMFYYFSVLFMTIGVVLVISEPKSLETPLYACYGLFLSSGIMKNKFKKITNACR